MSETDTKNLPNFEGTIEELKEILLTIHDWSDVKNFNWKYANVLCCLLDTSLANEAENCAMANAAVTKVTHYVILFDRNTFTAPDGQQYKPIEVVVIDPSDSQIISLSDFLEYLEHRMNQDNRPETTKTEKETDTK